MSGLRTPGFPEAAVRARARTGVAAAFPDLTGYGSVAFGAAPAARGDGVGVDPLDAVRLVPPVFVPGRLEMLMELGREPMPGDVSLNTVIGGFAAPYPLFLSALGSTRAVSTDLGLRAGVQAGRLGIPMVVGENVVPVNGFGRQAGQAGAGASLSRRLRAYAEELPAALGGFVVQQSTEDADAEVWNLVYSDPSATALRDSGRLAFELKVGQGAKPGLGGMTVLAAADAEALSDRYDVGQQLDHHTVLRCATPGTFTTEILRQQIRLMRNNFPLARIWVKLPPGRDVALAAEICWTAGADAVTVDGAEGGTGWSPTAFLDCVGLPLGECLRRVEAHGRCLLATGRMWEGARVAKALALGATATGLGRAALLAVDEDPDAGLVRLVAAAAFELRLLASAMGKYAIGELSSEDLWPSSVGATLTDDVLPTNGYAT